MRLLFGIILLCLCISTSHIFGPLILLAYYTSHTLVFNCVYFFLSWAVQSLSSHKPGCFGKALLKVHYFLFELCFVTNVNTTWVFWLLLFPYIMVTEPEMMDLN